ncbi:hypothetical protein R1flu_012681 [Riccia fluitans]|uniref:Uncharacterized protein n=1 Tax=Riccia fluitans TaxID=41844 RepID=A0ABD1ZDT2_9MARC
MRRREAEECKQRTRKRVSGEEAVRLGGGGRKRAREDIVGSRAKKAVLFVDCWNGCVRARESERSTEEENLTSRAIKEGRLDWIIIEEDLSFGRCVEEPSKD